MWTALISPITQLAGTFLEGQVNKQKAKSKLALTEAEAKAKIMTTAAEHDSQWELIMAKNAGSSWRDEFVTIIVLIPVILAFIPGMEEVVNHGFSVLSELPEWYTYLVYIVCLSALGIKGVDKFRNKK